MRVVLASTSRTRARLLRSAGVGFEICAPGVDEDAVKQALDAETAPPAHIAETLAELKALRGGARHPDALVIGADQALELGGRRLDKPTDRDAARTQLRALSGAAHTLVSAACVAGGGAIVWREVARARLHMRALSDAFIEAYLDAIGDEAFEGPGAYRLERRGAQLMTRVDGDYFTVLGLPLFGLLGYLRERGALEV